MTDKQKGSTIPLLLTVCIVTILIILSLFNLAFYTFYQKREYVLGVNDVKSNEITYWNKFLEENPTYMDGWLKLAELELNDGDPDKAMNAYLNAKKINPNSEKLKKIEVLLNL